MLLVFVRSTIFILEFASMGTRNRQFLAGYNPKNPDMSCPKGIIPTFLFFSDGIGSRKILFDREGSFDS